jgi:hypothetical protein
LREAVEVTWRRNLVIDGLNLEVVFPMWRKIKGLCFGKYVGKLVILFRYPGEIGNVGSTSRKVG